MFVDHLPTGAPMWYDKDPQFSAAVVSARGGIVYEEVERERVTLEPIVMAVWPKVHVLDAATARFDILNREQVRAQHEMAELEDEKFLSAVHFSSLTATDRNTQVSATAGLTRQKLAEAFALVERYDMPIANIIMHAQELRDIRSWTNKDFWKPKVSPAATRDVKGCHLREHPGDGAIRREDSGKRTLNDCARPSHGCGMMLQSDRCGNATRSFEKCDHDSGLGLGFVNNSVDPVTQRLPKQRAPGTRLFESGLQKLGYIGERPSRAIPTEGSWVNQEVYAHAT